MMRPEIGDDAARSVPRRLEQGLDAIQELVKPRLRGWLHAGLFPIAILLGVVLVLLCPDARTRLATGVFAVTTSMLFCISALYHRGHWSERTCGVLRRVDHASIFVIIAGSYTPYTVLLLPPKTARTLLWIVWGGAVLGVAFRLLWVGAPRWLYVLICTTLGWVAVLYLPQFWRGGGAAVMILVLLGGAFYTTGGVVYALRRPDPSPRWFGFHEVFHAFTVAAFLTHFAGLCLVLRLNAAVHR